MTRPSTARRIDTAPAGREPGTDDLLAHRLRVHQHNKSMLEHWRRANRRPWWQRLLVNARHVFAGGGHQTQARS